jgi:branched-chain amino acid aminotransferase
MNFFLYWVNKNGEKELITCNLNGEILPGVIRDSVLQLSKKWGIKTTEREFTIQELIEAQQEGRIFEAFGTGTAAIVCPVNNINYKGENYNMLKDTSQQLGELAGRLYNYLLDIQTGVIKDQEWISSIDI